LLTARAVNAAEAIQPNPPASVSEAIQSATCFMGFLRLL
jgi:hypothetical protein